MAIEPRSVTAIFNPSETDHMLRCVQLAITSYERSQKQRPEFQETAKRIADELKALETKIKGLPK